MSVFTSDFSYNVNTVLTEQTLNKFNFLLFVEE